MFDDEQELEALLADCEPDTVPREPVENLRIFAAAVKVAREKLAEAREAAIAVGDYIKKNSDDAHALRATRYAMPASSSKASALLI